jgi:DNA-binding transcriptional ArsR family regulator
MPVDDGHTERPGDEALPGLRRVSDAKTFRALAHPVRMALIELLVLSGPLTATEAGERIGESPTTCSFHLRQLARYGFVEEAGGGKGRARPWQISPTGLDFSSVQDDPETQLAAGALSRMLRDRQFQRYQAWVESRGSYPLPWQEAATDSQWVFWLTATELDELNKELSALLLPRVLERLSDPSARPAGALPVELLMFSYPVAPPPAEGINR